jgi:hypothetical protein
VARVNNFSECHPESAKLGQLPERRVIPRATKCSRAFEDSSALGLSAAISPKRQQPQDAQDAARAASGASIRRREPQTQRQASAPHAVGSPQR